MTGKIGHTGKLCVIANEGTMLVLTRKLNESIQIADNVVVTLLGISGNRVRLGIEAPAEMTIHRAELLELPAVGPKLAALAQV
jgi:carbon storage regulator